MNDNDVTRMLLRWGLYRQRFGEDIFKYIYLYLYVMGLKVLQGQVKCVRLCSCNM